MIQYLEPPRESSDIDGYFEAVVPVCGHPTTILFDLERATIAELEIPLEHCLKNTDSVFFAVSSAIQRELLPLYNDHWRCYLTGTGEEVERQELSLDEFLATISLEDIALSDSLIQLWYDDDYLFHGHTIQLLARYTTGPEGVALDSFTAGLAG